MQRAQAILVGAVLGVEKRAALAVEESADDGDDPRRVEHVDGRLPVLGRDSDGGVLLRRRGAPDEERQVDPAPLHLLRDRHHLVQRGRDETGEADDVAVLLDGDVQDPVGRRHHPEVDHLVAVAPEHDADDVLADVVHVALDRRHDDASCGGALGLLRLHVRLEVPDGALHRASALDHLRQEHLPRAEEVADDLHPVHERTFDHVERTRGTLTRLLRVLLDEVHDPVHERVRESLLHGRLAPREVELPLRRTARDRPRVVDEPLGGVGPPVEDDVLDALEQIRLDVLVHRELAGVDDPHVEPVADRVVQERGVHGLAHGVVAAERERQVRDPARDERAGAAFLQERDRVDERLRVARVLLDAGRDREDVRIHDHVLRREAGFADQQVVRAPEDLDLALHGVGLPLLVERHDDDRRAERAHDPRLLEERLLALLQRDRVHDPLALEAAQPRLERREAGAVDHDREPRGLRLGRHEVEEGRHRLLGVEQVGVHVHVEEVRAAAHLLERDVHRTLEVVRLDEPPELRRARHVRALADDHEARVRPDAERLEAREARNARRLDDAARRQALDRAHDRVRVLGRRAAAAADEVDEAVLRERAQVAARVRGLLVVEPEGVRQPRVRMAGDVRGRAVREALEKRPHLRRPERAVDAHDERLGVLDRDPERLRGLAREVPSAPVDRGERQPERDLGRNRARGDDRRLRVQRVEDRLDQQEVDAAVAERRDLLLVGRLHLPERDRAIGRILDLRRQGERDVERPYRAGDEPWLVGRPRSPGVRGGTCEARSFEAHLRGVALEGVVRLPDRGRREGVRRRDVRAGLEVRVVDLGDDLRCGQIQEVGIALDVVRVRREALAAVHLLRQLATVDEDAPGSVEHQDALLE